jgi:transketolase
MTSQLGTERELELFAARMRRMIIERAKAAGVGHIGSALSVVDVLAALYGRVLRLSPDNERDRFILSKGHAALALYCALYERGLISRELLESYCADGSPLGAHPEHEVSGIDFSTGSLGHGLSLGAGAALAARLQRSSRQIYVLLSDGECNEGSLWEAVMFAAHHRLRNLTAVVDLNGQQAFGYTHEVLDLSPLAERFAAFGWDVHEIDGHEPARIASLLEALRDGANRPQMVIARTTFGRGVSFMESKIDWHYWPLDDEQYTRALADLASLDELGGAG